METGATGKDRIKTQVALPSTSVGENSNFPTFNNCRRMPVAVIVLLLVLLRLR